MPHIIFTGKVDLMAAWKAFGPQVINKDNWITKVSDAFLNASQTVLLFEATAVYRGVTHNFYVRAETKHGQQLTVRIEPRTNVEKNDGVKRAVVLVGRFLQSVASELKMEKSNLPVDMLKDLR